ncbi:MAG: hypothetical protein KBD00_04600 [Candidatus Peribacteraceae bacterium]|nr:hypothetical protein [Candidatus Peribacteraceae bacterium]
MKVTVSTGHTKAPASTLLVPIVLGDSKGEQVFFLIQSEGKPGGTGNLQEECVAVLTHSVLEGEGDAYTRLESALKELNGLLKGFQLTDAVKDVSSIVGLLEADGNLHLSHVGRSEAYLIREGVATQITEYSRGKQPSSFLHIVTGPIDSGDNVLLSTQRLLREFTPAQLSQLVVNEDEPLDEIISTLEAEKEAACIIHLSVPQGAAKKETELPAPAARMAARQDGRRSARRQAANNPVAAFLSSVQLPSFSGVPGIGKMKARVGSKVSHAKNKGGKYVSGFLEDLSDPKRKRKAHLLLLAGAAGLFLIVWLIIQVSLISQKSQSRGELAALITQINADIQTADNRKLAGDTDSANAILKRAEDRAHQVMANETGLYRSDALNLLDKIRSKREEMNNITRIPPRVMANLSAKKSDVSAQGMIGIADGEFVVYDRQDLYRVLLNSVDGPTRLNTEELIVDGADFQRFQSTIYLTTGNSVIEVNNNQPTIMKTEDTSGWVTGVDVKTYLRNMYILSPERKQIYKYEHLSGRFGPSAEYNVNGDLTGAIDMVITGPIYVLKETTPATATVSGGREVIKLLRGEKQSFSIRNLPPSALNGVTKIFKSSPSGNFYFLDPTSKRVIVTTNDGDLGDSLYIRQYVLDSDQVGKLQDVYANPDDSRLYVLDEKRVYSIDLQAR